VASPARSAQGMFDGILEAFREFEEWVPGIFGDALEFMVEIPEAVELRLYDLADAHGNTSKECAETLSRVMPMFLAVSKQWSGDGAAQDFLDKWQGLIAEVSAAQAMAENKREVVQSNANAIEMMKFMAAMDLVMLLMTLYSLIMAAIATFGIAGVAAPGAVAACRTAIKSAADKLLAQLAKKGVEKAVPAAVKEAAAQAAKRAAEKAAEKALAKELARKAAEEAAKKAAGTATKKAVEKAAAKAAEKAAGKAAARALEKGLTKEAAATAAEKAGEKAAEKAAEKVGQRSLTHLAAQPFRSTAGRIAANKAAEQAGGRAARTALRREMRDKLAAEIADRQMSRLAVRAAVREQTSLAAKAASEQAVKDFANAGFKKVVTEIGRDAVHKGVMFAGFTAATEGGVQGWQVATGHRASLDLVGLAEHTASGFAVGALGAPLSLGGSGMVAQTVAMGGGTLAVDAGTHAVNNFLADQGVHGFQHTSWSEWWGNEQTNLAKSSLYGAMNGAGHMKNSVADLRAETRVEVGKDKGGWLGAHRSDLDAHPGLDHGLGDGRVPESMPVSIPEQPRVGEGSQPAGSSTHSEPSSGREATRTDPTGPGRVTPPDSAAPPTHSGVPEPGGHHPVPAEPGGHAGPAAHADPVTHADHGAPDPAGRAPAVKRIEDVPLPEVRAHDPGQPHELTPEALRQAHDPSSAATHGAEAARLRDIVTQQMSENVPAGDGGARPAPLADTGGIHDRLDALHDEAAGQVADRPGRTGHEDARPPAIHDAHDPGGVVADVRHGEGTEAPRGPEHGHAGEGSAAGEHARLEEQRLHDLGMDPATGGFRAAEAETARRIEQEVGVRLLRSADPRVDWVDHSGTTYDAVGNFDAQHFDRQWPHLQTKIVDHLAKADRVPVDVSKFTREQAAEVSKFIEDKKLGPRAFLTGAADHAAHDHADRDHDWEASIPRRTGEDLDTSWGHTYDDARTLPANEGGRDAGGVRVRVDQGGDGPPARGGQGHEGVPPDRQSGGRSVRGDGDADRPPAEDRGPLAGPGPAPGVDPIGRGDRPGGDLEERIGLGEPGGGDPSHGAELRSSIQGPGEVRSPGPDGDPGVRPAADGRDHGRDDLAERDDGSTGQGDPGGVRNAGDSSQQSDHAARRPGTGERGSTGSRADQHGIARDAHSDRNAGSPDPAGRGDGGDPSQGHEARPEATGPFARDEPAPGVPETRILGPDHLAPLEDPAYQRAVEDSLRSPDGFVVGADPLTHPYRELVNDGGPSVPGRNSNCVDCALSAVSSFYGRPEVSVPRWPDLVPEGGPAHPLGEVDGYQRVEAWLGTSAWSSHGVPDRPMADQYAAVHDHVDELGPGSSAVVAIGFQKFDEHDLPVFDDEGRRVADGEHVVTVVFPHEASHPVWWDPQSGEAWPSPPPDLVSDTASLHFIAVDSHGRTEHGRFAVDDGGGKEPSGGPVRGTSGGSDDALRVRLGRDAGPVGRGAFSGSRFGDGEVRDRPGRPGDHHSAEPGVPDDREAVRGGAPSGEDHRPADLAEAGLTRGPHDAAADPSAHGPEHPSHAGSLPPAGEQEHRRPALSDLIPRNDHEAIQGIDAIRRTVVEEFDQRQIAGFRVRVDPAEVLATPGQVRVRLEIVHPEYGHVGHTVRVWARDRDGTTYAVTNSVKITHAGMHGEGFSRAFDRYLEGRYRESGFDRVELRAASTNGGYVWARAGYDWALNTRHSAEAILTRLVAEQGLIDRDAAQLERWLAGDRTVDGGALLRQHRATDPGELLADLQQQSEAAAEVLQAAREHTFGSAEYPTPFEISQTGWNGDRGADATWIGKRAMMGSDWQGIKWLSSAASGHDHVPGDMRSQSWRADLPPERFTPSHDPDAVVRGMHVRADRLWYAATANEPRITAAIDDAVHGMGTRIVGEHGPVEHPDEVRRRIAEELDEWASDRPVAEAAARLQIRGRYAIELPHDGFAESSRRVAAMLSDRGYEQVRVGESLAGERGPQIESRWRDLHTRQEFDIRFEAAHRGDLPAGTRIPSAEDVSWKSLGEDRVLPTDGGGRDPRGARVRVDQGGDGPSTRGGQGHEGVPLDRQPGGRSVPGSGDADRASTADRGGLAGERPAPGMDPIGRGDRPGDLPASEAHRGTEPSDPGSSDGVGDPPRDDSEGHGPRPDAAGPFGRSDPAPRVADTRIVGPEHLAPIEDPAYQRTLEESLRSPAGFVVGADPLTHPYRELINDGGPSVPGRDSNCVDCSLSAISSFYGHPEVSAPRSLDLLPDGSPSQLGELNSFERLEDWLGAPDWSNSWGPGRTIAEQYVTLHDHVDELGPGSSAVLAIGWQEFNADGVPVFSAEGLPVIKSFHTLTVVFPSDASHPVWWDPQYGKAWPSPPPHYIDRTASLHFIALDAAGRTEHGRFTVDGGRSESAGGERFRPSDEHDELRVRLGRHADPLGGGAFSGEERGDEQVRDRSGGPGNHVPSGPGLSDNRGGIRGGATSGADHRPADLADAGLTRPPREATADGTTRQGSDPAHIVDAGERHDDRSAVEPRERSAQDLTVDDGGGDGAPGEHFRAADGHDAVRVRLGGGGDPDRRGAVSGEGRGEGEGRGRSGSAGDHVPSGPGVTDRPSSPSATERHEVIPSDRQPEGQPARQDDHADRTSTGAESTSEPPSSRVPDFDNSAEENRILDSLDAHSRAVFEDAIAAAQERADIVLPELRDLAGRLTAALPGDEPITVVGENHRVKRLPSLARAFENATTRKIILAQHFAAELYDLVRFSLRVPGGDHYAPHVRAVLDEMARLGYRIDRVKNYWQAGNRYYGLHVDLRGRDGGRLEVQFPTKATWSISEQTHLLYERVRLLHLNAYDRIGAFLKTLSLVKQVGIPNSLPPHLDRLGYAVKPKDTSFAKSLKDNSRVWGHYLATLEDRGVTFEQDLRRRFGLNASDLHLPEGHDDVQISRGPEVGIDRPADTPDRAGDGESPSRGGLESRPEGMGASTRGRGGASDGRRVGDDLRRPGGSGADRAEAGHPTAQRGDADPHGPGKGGRDEGLVPRDSGRGQRDRPADGFDRAGADGPHPRSHLESPYEDVEIRTADSGGHHHGGLGEDLRRPGGGGADRGDVRGDTAERGGVDPHDPGGGTGPRGRDQGLRTPTEGEPGAADRPAAGDGRTPPPEAHETEPARSDPGETYSGARIRPVENLDPSWSSHGNDRALPADHGGRDAGGVRVRPDPGGDEPPAGRGQGHEGVPRDGRPGGRPIPRRGDADGAAAPGGRSLAGEGAAAGIDRSGRESGGFPQPTGAEPLRRGPDGQILYPRSSGGVSGWGDPPGSFRTADGVLHFDGDRTNSYRDEPTHRLHHPLDPAGTHRDEHFHLVDTASLDRLDDPLLSRPVAHPAQPLGRTQHWPDGAPPEVRAAMDHARAAAAARQEVLRTRLRPLLEEFGVAGGPGPLHDRELDLILTDLRGQLAGDPARQARLDDLRSAAEDYTGARLDAVREAQHQVAVAAARHVLVDPFRVGEADVLAVRGRDGQTIALGYDRSADRLVVVETGRIAGTRHLVDDGTVAQRGSHAYLRDLLLHDEALHRLLGDHQPLLDAVHRAAARGELAVGYHRLEGDADGRVFTSELATEGLDLTGLRDSLPPASHALDPRAGARLFEATMRVTSAVDAMQEGGRRRIELVDDSTVRVIPRVGRSRLVEIALTDDLPNRYEVDRSRLVVTDTGGYRLEFDHEAVDRLSAGQLDQMVARAVGKAEHEIAPRWKALGRLQKLDDRPARAGALMRDPVRPGRLNRADFFELAHLQTLVDRLHAAPSDARAEQGIQRWIDEHGLREGMLGEKERRELVAARIPGESQEVLRRYGTIDRAPDPAVANVRAMLHDRERWHLSDGRPEVDLSAVQVPDRDLFRIKPDGWRSQGRASFTFEVVSDRLPRGELATFRPTRLPRHYLLIVDEAAAGRREIADQYVLRGQLRSAMEHMVDYQNTRAPDLLARRQDWWLRNAPTGASSGAWGVGGHLLDAQNLGLKTHVANLIDLATNNWISLRRGMDAIDQLQDLVLGSGLDGLGVHRSEAQRRVAALWTRIEDLAGLAGDPALADHTPRDLADLAGSREAVPSAVQHELLGRLHEQFRAVDGALADHPIKHIQGLAVRKDGWVRLKLAWRRDSLMRVEVVEQTHDPDRIEVEYQEHAVVLRVSPSLNGDARRPQLHEAIRTVITEVADSEKRIYERELNLRANFRRAWPELIRGLSGAYPVEQIKHGAGYLSGAGGAVRAVVGSAADFITGRGEAPRSEVLYLWNKAWVDAMSDSQERAYGGDIAEAAVRGDRVARAFLDRADPQSHRPGTDLSAPGHPPPILAEVRTVVSVAIHDVVDANGYQATEGRVKTLRPAERRLAAEADVYRLTLDGRRNTVELRVEYGDTSDGRTVTPLRVRKGHWLLTVRRDADLADIRAEVARVATAIGYVRTEGMLPFRARMNEAAISAGVGASAGAGIFAATGSTWQAAAAGIGSAAHFLRQRIEYGHEQRLVDIALGTTFDRHDASKVPPREIRAATNSYLRSVERLERAADTAAAELAARSPSLAGRVAELDVTLGPRPAARDLLFGAVGEELVKPEGLPPGVRFTAVPNREHTYQAEFANNVWRGEWATYELRVGFTGDQAIRHHIVDSDVANVVVIDPRRSPEEIVTAFRRFIGGEVEGNAGLPSGFQSWQAHLLAAARDTAGQVAAGAAVVATGGWHGADAIVQGTFAAGAGGSSGARVATNVWHDGHSRLLGNRATQHARENFDNASEPQMNVFHDEVAALTGRVWQAADRLEQLARIAEALPPSQRPESVRRWLADRPGDHSGTAPPHGGGPPDPDPRIPAEPGPGPRPSGPAGHPLDSWTRIDERPDGVVAQRDAGASGAAAAEMLSRGEVSQDRILEQAGMDPPPQALADALDAGSPHAWRAGSIEGTQLDGLAARGPWAAEIAGEGGRSHYVVVDRLTDSGRLVHVRDPWGPGTRYAVERERFLEDWTGNAVYRHDQLAHEPVTGGGASRAPAPVTGRGASGRIWPRAAGAGALLLAIAFLLDLEAPAPPVDIPPPPGTTPPPPPGTTPPPPPGNLPPVGPAPPGGQPPGAQPPPPGGQPPSSTVPPPAGHRPPHPAPGGGGAKPHPAHPVPHPQHCRCGAEWHRISVHHGGAVPQLTPGLSAAAAAQMLTHGEIDQEWLREHVRDGARAPEIAEALDDVSAHTWRGGLVDRRAFDLLVGRGAWAAELRGAGGCIHYVVVDGLTRDGFVRIRDPRGEGSTYLMRRAEFLRVWDGVAMFRDDPPEDIPVVPPDAGLVPGPPPARGLTMPGHHRSGGPE
jgi:hypothetical protein